ncbi:MAG: hypothetical protein CMB96_04475 [Flavobacteriaceae bacterium]|nr:hypothetical protein [Flavobacteriaceae bacterium]
MEFPIDIWRLIKCYQIPYKAYWKKQFDACIYQLNPNNYISPNITRCSRIGGKRHRRGHPRRGKRGLEIKHDVWWKNHISRIESIETVFKNGFIYHHNAVYYPSMSRSCVVTPSYVLYITMDRVWDAGDMTYWDMNDNGHLQLLTAT